MVRATETATVGLAPPSRPAPAAARPTGSRQPPRLSGRSSYSLFVGLMKVLLPAMAAALVLLVIVWPQLIPDERFRIGVSQISLEQADSLAMLNPRFDGRDSSNRPFSITADLATQASGGSDVIDLELPKADITLEDGTWLALTAQTGRYRRKAETVEMQGDVVVFHDQGFEMRTEEAFIDLEAGTATGATPVEGQGPAGLLNAEGFQVTGRGARILFTGKSQMVLYSASPLEAQ